MTLIPSPLLSPFEVGTTVDEAWVLPTSDRLTNNHLRDGDMVELEAATKGEFGGGLYVVPRGTLRTVQDAKAQRAKRHSSESSHFFAIVEVVVEGCAGIIRVPHAALRVMSKVPTRPDAVRRNR